MLVFHTPPLFDDPAWWNPLDFLDEIYHARDGAISYGKNFIILTSTIFD